MYSRKVIQKFEETLNNPQAHNVGRMDTYESDIENKKLSISSPLARGLIGKTLEEAKNIKDREIAELLELPSIKIHCSVLAEDSIKKAIADYESKKT